MTIIISTTAYGKVTKRHQAALEELMGVSAKEVHKEGYWFGFTCYKTRKALVVAMLDYANKLDGLWDTEELLTWKCSKGWVSLFAKA